MSKKLTSEEVIVLARLARLNLSKDEVTKYQRELSEILEYIETLNQADTSNIEPTLQVTGLLNVTRKDIVIANQVANPSDLLSGTPHNQDGYIKVGRMI